MQRKHKKLTDFIHRESKTNVKDREDQLNEREKEKDVDKAMTKQENISYEDVIREVLESISHRYMIIGPETKEQQRAEEEQRAGIEDKPHEERRKIFDENILNQLAIEAYQNKDISFIECDKSGKCKDGKKIGDVFEDSRGIKWQRTFIDTTRSPIHLNFVTEAGEIKGRVGKAYVIVSSRGAQAIIPEDYICEAISRYGVLLNLDKCIGYRSSPWKELERRKQK
ncbi:MAG: hypothetical protein QXE81_04685 [Desulfurococcaceae archaeon]